jgi:hypothetical protein
VGAWHFEPLRARATPRAASTWTRTSRASVVTRSMRRGSRTAAQAGRTTCWCTGRGRCSDT